MIKFEIKWHKIRLGEVVEIHKDGEFIATITVDEKTNEVRLVTKHFERIEVDSSDHDPEITLTAVRVFLNRITTRKS